ncbi:MAG: 6-phosphofructokinase [Chloroflexi bacterium]|nr:MAG: 6-phosphofructokinase [Chloroflexota bacterium]PIE80204.1 MAG: 6-phosphofructokinase [Chloroflexota bacterium]
MDKIGVFTSGGDAQGMNAAVRAVVRAALDYGTEVLAIYEGYQGMVDGGDNIRPISWNDVGGILYQGGTMIGSARSIEFRERAGRLKAVENLIKAGIDTLVCVGGDGSLTGANLLHQEWPGLLQELVKAKRISQKAAQKHPQLALAGIIGSIDNDMYGSDMTTGADTALHRIVEAVDAITSTAASHQRSFVIEVMGRHCGYLALMAGLATGADWVLIPEAPPNLDNWEDKMCDVLSQGREIGRRDSIVIVAEGAQDRYGKPITSEHVRKTLEERLGEDTRITVLGHVQRGGSPSAFDRNLATQLGVQAVKELLNDEPGVEPFVMGIQGNIITRTPLAKCLELTQAVGNAVQAGEFETAMDLRGCSFNKSFRTLRTLVRALPHEPIPGQRRMRIAVLNAGGPSPGMNTAVRAAVRLGVDKGHIMMGVNRGFRGLIRGEIKELDWMSVAGLAPMGGSELGTNRTVPQGGEWYAIARNLEEYQLEAILMIGGLTGYQAVHEMFRLRENYPAFDIPMICLPASINNNLPGSQLSVGADTALNSIVDAVDKIKQSAVASRRTFVVEVMGHYCGYLALMSGLATGAERVYIHEDGVTLADMVRDTNMLIDGFEQGKRVGLMIRNEHANDIYTTDFMRALFEEEGGNLFDVRQAILGHLQQGGNPTPYDRILATRLASDCIDYLEKQINEGKTNSSFIGLVGGEFELTSMEELPRMVDSKHGRPKEQWWMGLRQIVDLLAQAKPQISAHP